MRILKNIFARIWALWGLMTFFVTFLIIFIPSMLTWLLPDPAGQRVFIGISRMWMNVWLVLVGCPVKVNGRRNFQNGQAYIVTSNHNSLMDVPLTSPYIPGANKTIAKSSFVKVPLFGFFYMKGSILVNRKSEKSRRESFDKMKAVLAKGMHMCIYPEGTRNRSSEPIKKFHDGAFRLAVTTGTPVIPTVIFNTRKALPANRPFYFLPTKLRMDFLPPVFPGQMSVEELKETVHAIMQEHFITNGGMSQFKN